MQKRDGQGKTESYTESGEEEAKGGAKMQKINRENVVQAALIVERWCVENHRQDGKCDCPLRKWSYDCYLIRCNEAPYEWNLEKFLRARGLKHD